MSILYFTHSFSTLLLKFQGITILISNLNGGIFSEVPITDYQLVQTTFYVEILLFAYSLEVVQSNGLIKINICNENESVFSKPKNNIFFLLKSVLLLDIIHALVNVDLMDRVT